MVSSFGGLPLLFVMLCSIQCKTSLYDRDDGDYIETWLRLLLELLMFKKGSYHASCICFIKWYLTKGNMKDLSCVLFLFSTPCTMLISFITSIWITFILPTLLLGISSSPPLHHNLLIPSFTPICSLVLHAFLSIVLEVYNTTHGRSRTSNTVGTCSGIDM